MERRLKILTTVEERRATSSWHARTDLYSLKAQGIIEDWADAIRIYKKLRHYDVVIFHSCRPVSLCLLIMSLFRRQYPAVIIIDCLWYQPSSAIALFVKRLGIQNTARVVTKFVVWASHEVKDYAETFGIAEDKLQYIPHHHTLESYSYEISSGNYVFSGGDGDRDYATLFKALEGIDVPVIIASRRKDLPVPPPNVRINPVTPTEFRDLMAGAKLVVVPMQKGLLHSGGQQTYLNAMALGKPVVVADDSGASDYIEHGINGLIVPSEDVQALRAAILDILGKPEFASKLAANAGECMDRFSTARCMEAILQLAETLG